MRYLLVIFTVCVAAGQDPPPRSSGQAYVFYGLDKPRGAGLSELMTMGGGADALLYKGLGVGFDLGYQCVRGHCQNGVGLLSVDGCYHLQNRIAGGRLVPFVTGGYALAFRNGHLNLYNFGGGATWWFHRRVGFRMELRDYRQATYGEYATGLRFGLSFR